MKPAAKPSRNARRKIVRRKRQAFALARQCHGASCFYCRTAPGDTMDHLVPVALGGRLYTDWKNLVPCCFACNQAKGCRLPTGNELQRVKASIKAYEARPAPVPMPPRLDLQELDAALSLSSPRDPFSQS